MAAKGKKASRNGPPPAPKAAAVAGDVKDGPEKAGGGKDGPEKAGGGGGFFCCYLLRSLCPRSTSRTYIGYPHLISHQKMSSLFLASPQHT
jgi:structure-specific endonuclease subunit SLX1